MLVLKSVVPARSEVWRGLCISLSEFGAPRAWRGMTHLYCSCAIYRWSILGVRREIVGTSYVGHYLDDQWAS